MTRTTRRRLLRGTLSAGAAGMLAASSYRRVLGANDDVRIGVVGFRGKGGGHIKAFRKMAGVRVVALCDVDDQVIAGTVKQFDKDNEKVYVYKDVRELLERKDVDAIVTATPNHWHALVTVWACQAGKDVYVEKPVSWSIWEGRKAVEAARKYNRVVQAGTQQRSDEMLPQVWAWLREGHLGKIRCARGFCYKPRGSIGKVTRPTPIPDDIDYDLWSGPATMVPLWRSRLHYDWHWVWLTGNGDIGNQGIHQMDVCRWALGDPDLAPRVVSIGGRFGYDDDGETANTQVVFFDYKPAPLVFEVRGLPEKKGSKTMPNYKGVRIGEVIECEGGYFAGGWAYDNDGKKVKQFSRDKGRQHQPNFVKAVRSRKPEDNKADILKGHLSSALCHMGNVSHRIGERMSADKVAKAVADHPFLAEAYERMLQHLEANEVDLKTTPITLGPRLEMDPKTERFTGEKSKMANLLLKRNYREPFVVPEEV